jgi:hypothetical protein
MFPRSYFAATFFPATYFPGPAGSGPGALVLDSDFYAVLLAPDDDPFGGDD